jgi:hypothetical protein
VLLSAQTDATAEALAAVLRGLRQVPPPRPVLAYGGWIFNHRPELRASTPGVYLGSDARAALATVERLLGAGPGAPGATSRSVDLQK